MAQKVTIQLEKYHLDVLDNREFGLKYNMKLILINLVIYLISSDSSQLYSLRPLHIPSYKKLDK